MRINNLELFPLDYLPQDVQHIVSGLDVAQTTFIGNPEYLGVSVYAQDGVNTFLYAPSFFYGIADYGDIPGLQFTYPPSTLVGGTGDDVLWGGNADDTLRGGEGSDAIFGNDGDDYIEGGDGDDFIYGGTGDDIIFGQLGADIIETGGGADDIRFDVEDSLIGSADHVTDFNANQDAFYLMTFSKDNWDYDLGSRQPSDITETSGVAGSQQAIVLVPSPGVALTRTLGPAM